MPIFGILSVICIGFYIFYRVQYFRIKQPYHRQWLSSKATIALGLFMLFFGVDQLLLWHTTTAKVVGSVFALVGTVYAVQGFRTYRFYQPKAIEEAEQKHKA
ncbi:YtpI family protein [Calidifontibacillus oryziterrae]|uniref:YtpI family protein n=1 Tax=Calidifontibacillus oryziterrae TaxID=1191699 RepID=UPI0002DFCE92|nr:YtpI family protein [Calidifontibacillus oryziterrae]